MSSTLSTPCPEPTAGASAPLVHVPRDDFLPRALKRVRIDRVECLWEPGMILAAKIREGLRRLQEQNLVDRYLNL